MSRIIRGRYRNTKRNRYRTTPYKWDFRNRSWDVGRRPVEGPDKMTLLNAGAGATFTGDTISPDGWTFDTADDTLWIGDTTTGIRIVNNGGTTAGFILQTIEFDSGRLLKFTGLACTRVVCYNSPTKISGELDISALTSLAYLHCGDNSISILDISALTSLVALYCHANSISILDVSTLTSLAYLNCYTNSISTLDVSALTSLVTLHCGDNSISTLDISALTSLVTLNCYTNSISTLDVSALTSLVTLDCSYNSISTLDVSALTSLVTLKCHSTNVTSFAAGAFDNLDSLEKLYWYDCSLSTAVVNLCITDFHTDRVAKTAMTELKLAGNNSAVTGTYQEPADHDNPANAAEAAWVLVNDEGWTVEINTV